MPRISIDELNRIEKMIRDDFNNVFRETPTTYQFFTSEIHDSENLTVLEWIGQLPTVVEWIGPRIIETLKDYDYTVRKRAWSMAVKVLYKKAFDRSGTKLSQMLRDRVTSMGQGFRNQYPANVIYDLLEAGESEYAFDGVPFFSDITGVRLFKNLFTGNGVDTADHILTDIAIGRSAMARYPNDQGRALNVIPDLIVCPPEAVGKFEEAVGIAMRAGSNNPYYGRYTLITDARLADANDWYFASTKQGMKPLLFVESQGPEVATRDNTFNDKSVDVGVDSEGNAGFGFPQLMAKFVNT
jgi:phage major head subunit gpT-like protein